MHSCSAQVCIGTSLLDASISTRMHQLTGSDTDAKPSCKDVIRVKLQNSEARPLQSGLQQRQDWSPGARGPWEASQADTRVLGNYQEGAWVVGMHGWEWQAASLELSSLMDPRPGLSSLGRALMQNWVWKGPDLPREVPFEGFRVPLSLRMGSFCWVSFVVGGQFPHF